MKLNSFLKQGSLLSALFFPALAASAQGGTAPEIRMTGAFSDHMVLQQKQVTPIWGSAPPGASLWVLPSWQKDTLRVKAGADGFWRVFTETPGAGGPFQIRIQGGGTQKVIQDVMVGEVWLCSGQSNMEWSSVNGLPEMEQELALPENKNIRLLNIQRATAVHPQAHQPESWQLCNAASLKKFSGIGYFFGKQLSEKLNVPVGIINSSWGGTQAELWVPNSAIAESALLQELADKQAKVDYRPTQPGIVYNAMIHPLLGYPIQGILWYQGESNVGTWRGYYPLMSSLIQTWRKNWFTAAQTYRDLPFYFVQIAPYQYRSADNRTSAYLREQQERTLRLPQTGMVVVNDLVENIQDIHPRQKKEVANRLFSLAAHNVYKMESLAPYQGSDAQSPLLLQSESDGKNGIIIRLSHTEKGLYKKDATGKLMALKGKIELTTLEVAGEDGVFEPAAATLEKGQFRVFTKSGKKAVSVRYGFTDTAQAELFNVNGLPVAPFRTDRIF